MATRGLYMEWCGLGPLRAGSWHGRDGKGLLWEARKSRRGAAVTAVIAMIQIVMALEHS